jgi:hypothetical protein
MIASSRQEQTERGLGPFNCPAAESKQTLAP